MKAQMSILGAVLVFLVACAGCGPQTTTEGWRKSPVTGKEESSVKLNDDVIRSCEKEWATKYLTSEGRGAVPPGYKDDPVGRQMARDAALVMCYDRLAQQVGEVHITTEITVLNAAVSSHRKMQLDTFVKQGKIIEDRWVDEDHVYLISMEMPLTELVGVLRTWKQ